MQIQSSPLPTGLIPGLDPDIDRTIGGIAQILPVLERREPSGLAGQNIKLCISFHKEPRKRSDGGN